VRAEQAARADPERREQYALECLRRWLNADPPPPVRRAAAYSRWVAPQNDDGVNPPLYSLTSLYESLSVDFHEALAVAENYQMLAEARAAAIIVTRPGGRHIGGRRLHRIDAGPAGVVLEDTDTPPWTTCPPMRSAARPCICQGSRSGTRACGFRAALQVRIP
jgi:hypothetical protein